MNPTLNDIDRSLTESKTKMKSDFERSLRGLNFGKLYLKNGEYETALKYVESYLSVRPNSSEAHKLLAQIYEAIGDDDTALLNYRKSLDLKKNSNENYLSSIQSPISTQSMSGSYRIVENNSNSCVESTPILKAKTPENNENKSHPCGTCSNQSLLNKISKQNENLMETHKHIMEILRQNNSSINDLQNQMVVMSEALNNLTDSQNLMKDTLYDYMAQEEHEGFDDYLLDDKENESLDTSALLGVSSQSNQWHSSGLQLMSGVDQSKPLSELFKPAVDSWQCQDCYVQNKGSETICAACTTPKPGAVVEPNLTEPLKTSFGFGSAQPFSFNPPVTNTNTGFTFGFANSESNTNTESNTIFSNTNFKFGNMSSNPSSVSTPPSFGLQTNKPNDIKSPQNMFSLDSSEPKTNSFQFGLNPNFDFQFPKFGEQQPLPQPQQPIKITSVSEEKVSNEREEENTSLNDSQVEPSDADNIFFQPVVPLPPKIEVKTGEEEENVLHSCRARLFRFCDGEWKERGVGELKILESQDSNRIRLLMRRDTIFKVCLNQSISQELKLDLKEDKKSITWSAIDYSEDTPNPQIFLLRLKNAENAQLFLSAVQTAQSKLIPEESSEKDIQSLPKIDDKQKSKNQTILKPNANSSEDNDIEIVYQKMPKSEEILKKVRELRLPLNFFDYEDMDPCPGCRGCNDSETYIFSIPEPKPTDMKTNETPDSVQESLFHSAIAATNISQTDWKTSSGGKPLWLARAPAPIFSSPRSPSQDDDNVEGNPDIYFKPLIPLPDLVEVKTGEEDENPIYCQRAKLYRYDPQTKEWKERGVGDFKILKHNSKNRFRMVLRRDQILKIACNHYITSLMSLNPMNTSETAVCWYAIDYTDGNPVEEQFAVKFKNKDILQAFVKLFNECKDSLDENEINNSYNEDTNDHNGTDPENSDRN